MARSKSCQRNVNHPNLLHKRHPHDQDSKYVSYNPASKLDIIHKEATRRGIQNVFETMDGMLEMELSKLEYPSMWTDFGHN